MADQPRDSMKFICNELRCLILLFAIFSFKKKIHGGLRRFFLSIGIKLQFEEKYISFSFLHLILEILERYYKIKVETENWT